MSRRSSRREFLRGRAAADLAADTGKADMPVEAAGAGRAQHADRLLLSAARRAMGCRFEFTAEATTPQLAATLTEALELIAHLEEQMSVFIAESELSRLNCLAASQPVPVEPRLFELLVKSKRLWQRTGGAFDIAAGKLVRLWGFVGGNPRVPQEPQLQETLQSCGMNLVELDEESRSVRFLRAGVELNLGAIGKGYSLDLAAALLRQREPRINALLSAGGSSVLAVAGDERTEPWPVGIAHPLHRGQRIGRVFLDRGALGTAGSTERFFVQAGRRWSHVLDPRTGWPVRWRMSVSVLTDEAAEADALATALLVMGPERAREFVSGEPQLGAIIVTWDSDGTGLAVEVLGRAEKVFEKHA